MAKTRSTSAATPLTLWSTSSTAWPSARKLAISPEKSATSAAVRPANGSSTSTTFGLRAIALASSSRRRSAKGSVRGRRCMTPPRPTRAAIPSARRRTAGSVRNSSRLSGSRARMMCSRMVWRCSGRACWKTMPTPWRAMRCGAQPATSMPEIFTDPALGRSMPMMHFITVDLPEPFGPIRPRISPGWMAKLMSLAATRPPKRLCRPATSSSALICGLLAPAACRGSRSV